MLMIDIDSCDSRYHCCHIFLLCLYIYLLCHMMHMVPPTAQQEIAADDQVLVVVVYIIHRS